MVHGSTRRTSGGFFRKNRGEMARFPREDQCCRACICELVSPLVLTLLHVIRHLPPFAEHGFWQAALRQSMR